MDNHTTSETYSENILFLCQLPTFFLQTEQSIILFINFVIDLN